MAVFQHASMLRAGGAGGLTLGAGWPVDGSPVKFEAGLTYDRALLRWASNWGMAVPWLRYALFWLRPAKEFEIQVMDQAGRLIHTDCIQSCRPQGLRLDGMRPDGCYHVATLILKHRPCIHPPLRPSSL